MHMDTATVTAITSRRMVSPVVMAHPAATVSLAGTARPIAPVRVAVSARRIAMVRGVTMVSRATMVRRATMLRRLMAMRRRLVMARQADTAAPVPTGRLPGTAPPPKTGSDRQVATDLATRRGMTRPMVTIAPAVPPPGMTLIGGPATVRPLATGREGGPAPPKVTGLTKGTQPRRATAIRGFRGGFRRTGTDREVAAGTAKRFDGMRTAVLRAGIGSGKRPGRARPGIPGGREVRTRHGVGPVCHATGTAGSLARCQHKGTGRGHPMTHGTMGRAGRRQSTALS